MIGEFQGPNRWLSNFWPCRVVYLGLTFSSVEQAYQAAKCQDLDEAASFVNLTPGQAKRRGRLVKQRVDWEEVKVGIMADLLAQKFMNPVLREQLLSTGHQQLVEGNTWGDTFWGVCRGQGENHLGRLLMTLRAQLQVTS